MEQFALWASWTVLSGCPVTVSVAWTPTAHGDSAKLMPEVGALILSHEWKLD